MQQALLRVGIFSNAYRPLVSGVVNSIDLIRKGLLRAGHTPFIYAPRVAGYRDEHAGVSRYPSVELTRKVQFPLPIPFWPPIHQRIARTGLQVLHTHHPFLLGDTALYWRRKLGVPLVYTFHTQYEQYVHYVPLPQAPLRALTRWAVQRFARRCDLLIAPSPNIRDLLSDYGIDTWTETLPNAIDLSRFELGHLRGPLRHRLGWPEEAVIGLYAGRIGKEKNLDFLLDAFRQVPDSLLAIVGDGPELGRLQARARALGLASRVLFPGRVEYLRMPEYFAAADYFCISSTTEVKPLVVLEALASGLPTVAVAACGTSDTLTDGVDGVLTPERIEPFARALRQVAENSGWRRELSRNARRTARQYSMDGYVERLVELYREAISRRARE